MVSYHEFMTMPLRKTKFYILNERTILHIVIAQTRINPLLNYVVEEVFPMGKESTQ